MESIDKYESEIHLQTNKLFIVHLYICVMYILWTNRFSSVNTFTGADRAVSGESVIDCLVAMKVAPSATTLLAQAAATLLCFASLARAAYQPGKHHFKRISLI